MKKRTKPFDVVGLATEYVAHAKTASKRARALLAAYRTGQNYQFEPYLAARAARSNWIHAARLLVMASGCGNSTMLANERCVTRILCDSKKAA